MAETCDECLKEMGEGPRKKKTAPCGHVKCFMCFFKAPDDCKQCMTMDKDVDINHNTPNKPRTPYRPCEAVHAAVLLSPAFRYQRRPHSTGCLIIDRQTALEQSAHMKNHVQSPLVPQSQSAPSTPDRIKAYLQACKKKEDSDANEKPMLLSGKDSVLTKSLQEKLQLFERSVSQPDSRPSSKEKLQFFERSVSHGDSRQSSREKKRGNADPLICHARKLFQNMETVECDNSRSSSDGTDNTGDKYNTYSEYRDTSSVYSKGSYPVETVDFSNKAAQDSDDSEHDYVNVSDHAHVHPSAQNTRSTAEPTFQNKEYPTPQNTTAENMEYSTSQNTAAENMKSSTSQNTAAEDMEYLTSQNTAAESMESSTSQNTAAENMQSSTSQNTASENMEYPTSQNKRYTTTLITWHSTHDASQNTGHLGNQDKDTATKYSEIEYHPKKESSSEMYHIDTGKNAVVFEKDMSETSTDEDVTAKSAAPRISMPKVGKPTNLRIQQYLEACSDTGTPKINCDVASENIPHRPLRENGPMSGSVFKSVNVFDKFTSNEKPKVASKVDIFRRQSLYEFSEKSDGQSEIRRNSVSEDVPSGLSKDSHSRHRRVPDMFDLEKAECPVVQPSQTNVTLRTKKMKSPKPRLEIFDGSYDKDIMDINHEGNGHEAKLSVNKGASLTIDSHPRVLFTTEQERPLKSDIGTKTTFDNTRDTTYTIDDDSKEFDTNLERPNNGTDRKASFGETQDTLPYNNGHRASFSKKQDSLTYGARGTASAIEKQDRLLYDPNNRTSFSDKQNTLPYDISRKASLSEKQNPLPYDASRKASFSEKQDMLSHDPNSRALSTDKQEKLSYDTSRKVPFSENRDKLSHASSGKTSFSERGDRLSYDYNNRASFSEKQDTLPCDTSRKASFSEQHNTLPYDSVRKVSISEKHDTLPYDSNRKTSFSEKGGRLSYNSNNIASFSEKQDTLSYDTGRKASFSEKQDTLSYDTSRKASFSEKQDTLPYDTGRKISISEKHDTLPCDSNHKTSFSEKGGRLSYNSNNIASFSEKQDTLPYDTGRKASFGEKQDTLLCDTGRKDSFSVNEGSLPYDTGSKAPFNEKQDTSYDTSRKASFSEKHNTLPYDTDHKASFGEKQGTLLCDTGRKDSLSVNEGSLPYDTGSKAPFNEKQCSLPYDTRRKAPFGKKHTSLQKYDPEPEVALRENPIPISGNNKTSIDEYSRSAPKYEDSSHKSQLADFYKDEYGKDGGVKENIEADRRSSDTASMSSYAINRGESNNQTQRSSGFTIVNLSDNQKVERGYIGMPGKLGTGTDVTGIVNDKSGNMVVDIKDKPIMLRREEQGEIIDRIIDTSEAIPKNSSDCSERQVPTHSGDVSIDTDRCINKASDFKKKSQFNELDSNSDAWDSFNKSNAYSQKGNASFTSTEHTLLDSSLNDSDYAELSRCVQTSKNVDQNPAHLSSQAVCHNLSVHLKDIRGRISSYEQEVSKLPRATRISSSDAHVRRLEKESAIASNETAPIDEGHNDKTSYSKSSPQLSGKRRSSVDQIPPKRRSGIPKLNQNRKSSAEDKAIAPIGSRRRSDSAILREYLRNNNLDTLERRFSPVKSDQKRRTEEYDPNNYTESNLKSEKRLKTIQSIKKGDDLLYNNTPNFEDRKSQKKKQLPSSPEKENVVVGNVRIGDRIKLFDTPQKEHEYQSLVSDEENAPQQRECIKNRLNLFERKIKENIFNADSPNVNIDPTPAEANIRSPTLDRVKNVKAMASSFDSPYRPKISKLETSTDDPSHNTKTRCSVSSVKAMASNFDSPYYPRIAVTESSPADAQPSHLAPEIIEGSQESLIRKPLVSLSPYQMLSSPSSQKKRRSRSFGKPSSRSSSSDRELPVIADDSFNRLYADYVGDDSSAELELTLSSEYRYNLDEGDAKTSPSTVDDDAISEAAQALTDLCHKT